METIYIGLVNGEWNKSVKKDPEVELPLWSMMGPCLSLDVPELFCPGQYDEHETLQGASDPCANTFNPTSAR